MNIEAIASNSMSFYSARQKPAASAAASRIWIIGTSSVRD